jgi:ABC-type enterochelin transport system substrate-binding protein
VVVYDVASLDTMDALGVDALTGVPQGNLPSYVETTPATTASMWATSSSRISSPSPRPVPT